MAIFKLKKVRSVTKEWTSFIFIYGHTVYDSIQRIPKTSATILSGCFNSQKPCTLLWIPLLLFMKHCVNPSCISSKWEHCVVCTVLTTHYTMLPFCTPSPKNSVITTKLSVTHISCRCALEVLNHKYSCHLLLFRRVEIPAQVHQCRARICNPY